MQRIFIELIDYNIRNINADWWKQLMGLFLKPGESFEIRCWREESDLIRQALAYGSKSEARSSGFEVSVTGVLTEQTIRDILDAKPPAGEDRMTRFFTVASSRIWSAHYGKQLIISSASETELRKAGAVLSPIRNCFSILEEDI